MTPTEILILKLLVRLARVLASGNLAKIQTVAGNISHEAEEAMK